MTPRETQIEIHTLFDARGREAYGEDVSQLEHALQCALLAREAQAPQSLVLAALLHDIGHLLHVDSQAAQDAGLDDCHERIGAKWLQSRWGEAVAEPVRLHVMAKRYLCLRQPGYWEGLSDASKHSLVLQGGPLDDTQARDFEQMAYWQEAVKLRLWDDEAKVVGKSTPGLEAFLG